MAGDIPVSREEKALMMLAGGGAKGGTLILRQGKLTWKQSAWGRLGLGRKGPKYLEIDVRTVAVAPAGRMIPWNYIAVGGILMFPIGAFTGWLRKCIAVQPEGEPEAYLFAVRDVEGWLLDVARAMPDRGSQ